MSVSNNNHHHRNSNSSSNSNNNPHINNDEPDGRIGEWNPVVVAAAAAGAAGSAPMAGGNGAGAGGGGSHDNGAPVVPGNNNAANNNGNNAEEFDRFSFEDSDRFEEDSLCSWSSEPESVCNNWRGWKKPTGTSNTFGFNTMRRSSDGELSSLTELAARCVATYIPFELVEELYPPVPEQMQLRIAFWSFPDNEEDIRLYSCLANSSADEFHRGEQLFKNRAVKEPLQIGFHLSATVVQTQPRNQHNVAVTFDRRRISSCSCTCLPTAYWCSHVVAVCLYRIHWPTKVSLRAPVSESLLRLQRDQLQKFAQYLISELSQQILPIAQRILDELLSTQPTTINTVCGAPDPTAGASVNDQTNWYLDEKTLHDNIKKILIKFCLPTPMVFSDVNYLTNSAPPAAAEWSSLLRPLRGREPEGMWNLLSIVREMYRRCDRNAIRLLEIITEEVMACDQILVWWFNIKLALLVGSNGHGGGGGGGGGGKHGNTHSNSNATQHACASLCDEIVVLWRLAALNPGLAPDERDMLHAQFTSWHLKIIDRVTKNMVASSSHSSKQQQNMRNDTELFAGFKPAIEACYLDWEDYPIEGVTHTQDTNPMYHCPFTCFKQNIESKSDTAGPGQVNASQAVLHSNVKAFQLMPHHHHHHHGHSFHGHYHHQQQQQQQQQHQHGLLRATGANSHQYSASAINSSSLLGRNVAGALASAADTSVAGGSSDHSHHHPAAYQPLSVSGTSSFIVSDKSTNSADMMALAKLGVSVSSKPTGATGDRGPVAGGSGGSSGGDRDICTKNQHRRTHRDRAYGSFSKSTNSSSDSVPDRLVHQQQVAGAVGGTSVGQSGSMSTPSGTSAGGAASESKTVAASDATGCGTGNRSSVSSEGFCENEDDLPADTNRLPSAELTKKPAAAGAGGDDSVEEEASTAGAPEGTEGPPATLLSVSNSSTSSASSSSSSSATDALPKKTASGSGEVASSRSSDSSNENSILNDMNNYEISGNIKLYEVLNVVEQEQSGEEQIVEPVVGSSSSSIGGSSVKRRNSAKQQPVTAPAPTTAPAGVAQESPDGRSKESEGATSSGGPPAGGNAADHSTVIDKAVAHGQHKPGRQQQHHHQAGGSQPNEPKHHQQQQQQVFSNLKPSEDAWDILFARAEGLHAHGHGREACTLGVRLAEEMLANPPNLMIDLPPPPKKKGKKHNINPISHQLSVLASATLSKCAFLCTVLAENSEHYHLAFRVCIFGLEMCRPPASTKPLEVKLANQESDLLALLKRIPLGSAELRKIRERAEQLRDGTLKSRGEALLPIMLASFIFDALVMPSVVGRENRMKVMSSPYRLPTDENWGFEAAVASLGLKANVSEAEHPLLCEGTRRQRGDLALTLLAYYKDEPRKICRIMEKLLDREIHVLIKTPLLPSYYSNNPPTRSQTSQLLRLDEFEGGSGGGGGSSSHNHNGNGGGHQLQQQQQQFSARGGGSSSSVGSTEAGLAGTHHVGPGQADFALVNSRPQSSTSAEAAELNIVGLSISGGGAAASSGGGGTSAPTLSATGNTTAYGMMGQTGKTTSSPSAANTTTTTTTSSSAAATTTSAVTTTRSKDSRYKGKRAYPSIPNQPSEASAHFMFELAKNVLTKAGGTSSTSLFTQATTNQNHQGPHRGLHMCAFQLGLYALGLHNCVSSNWLSRTYSSHVSWIIGQAMDIGAPAISFLIDTWEGHLTPPEAAGMADRASSRGWDSNMVNPAAELALSVLPHAAALNPNEIQRAILQCKEQSDRMLERACLTVENAAKGGGVYPEVLFQVSRYWYELFLRNTPGGELEPASEEHQHHEQYGHSFLSLLDVNELAAAAGAGQQSLGGGGAGSGGGGGGGGGGVLSGGAGLQPQQPQQQQQQQPVVVSATPPQPFQPVTTLAPIALSPYGYSFPCQSAIYHQNLPYPHPAAAAMQMYITTPPQFQYPPPPPPPGHAGQPTAPPGQPGQPGGQQPGQQQQQPPPPLVGGYQQPPLGAAAAAAAAYQSMQGALVGAPPQSYGTPPQYPVPVGGPPTNAAGKMAQPNLQQFYGAATPGGVAGGPPVPSQLAQQLPTVAAPGSGSPYATYSGGTGPQQQQQQQQQQQHLLPAIGNAGSSGGGGPGRPRHPPQFTPTQLRYLLAAYNAGMLALETLARRVHDDRPQAKYARNPPYGEDVKWLLGISKNLGTQYLHQFCICVVNSIVSPFVLHEVALESARYLARNNPALVMHHLRAALTPLMNKCQNMYFQCIHQKLYHLTVPDYEDFTSTILSARNAFTITPEGTAQFKDWLQSIKRSKSCKKELWTQINAALNSK
ncbi:zinc finger SWIM domain-containing protein 8 homolog [Anopheles bellator]|uniref:zinc finger SWIM domain-containing protein 8 homolog n=1 Tax=Anopheles bellator TaxID=139047 RepID=UPI00264A2ED5|nr:zinc finger SWIM domain-containing protein 8 homolog [Anopheles bellator]